MKKIKVAIAGATGFVGLELIKNFNQTSKCRYFIFIFSIKIKKIS